MTNLERAAAIAAERGVPLVEVYRGWAVYYTGEYAAACPHEMDWHQFIAVIHALGEDSLAGAPSGGSLNLLAGCYTKYDVRLFIDDFEAARDAMPATAFFGVEQEVLK